MTTPEERLCSRSWRLRNSVWLLWPTLSLGILTSVGLLLKGVKIKRRSWLLFAAAYGTWTLCFIVSSSFVEPGTKANPSDSVGSNILYSAMLILWLAGVVHCFYLNRGWLRWRAANPKGQTAWYASGAVMPDESAGGPPPRLTHDPSETLMNFYRGAASEPTQSGTLLDVNAAGPTELVAMGLDQLWVDRIVAARARLGGFQSADQLMTEAGVPPHVFAAIRGHVQVVNPPSVSRDSPSAGGGRRLDF